MAVTDPRKCVCLTCIYSEILCVGCDLYIHAVLTSFRAFYLLHSSLLRIVAAHQGASVHCYHGLNVQYMNAKLSQTPCKSYLRAKGRAQAQLTSWPSVTSLPPPTDDRDTATFKGRLKYNVDRGTCFDLSM